ncbi:MAG: substrate-binding domain-containing protein, partial [Bacteroidales bacterium]|nr:substrate-binding domain-containing protein [Bacteroidales bacterium]
MKRIILTSAIIFGMIFQAQTQQRIRIKGSDTNLPISQKVAEAYMKANPGTTLIVTGGGSGVGIAALVEGTTEIAQSSRKIKFD